jgi:hypothetical protein
MDADFEFDHQIALDLGLGNVPFPLGRQLVARMSAPMRANLQRNHDGAEQIAALMERGVPLHAATRRVNALLPRVDARARVVRSSGRDARGLLRRGGQASSLRAWRIAPARWRRGASTIRR